VEVNVENGYIALRHTLSRAPNGWLAWGIRTLTESYWNHGGQIVVINGIVFVIEAQASGVVMTPIAEFIDSKKYDIKIVRVREDSFASRKEYKKAIEHSTIFLQSKIGAKYDRGAIVWLAIYCIFAGLLKSVKVNPFHNRKKFFCFELICQAWHGTSSIISHLFAGTHHPEAECSVITGKDIGKAVSVEYVAGKDVK